MFVSDFDKIKITENGDNYVFDVSTKVVCSDNVILVLLTMDEEDLASTIPSASEWSGIHGKVTVEKKQLEGINQLYLYMTDPEFGNTNTIIRVYSEPLVLTKWVMTHDQNLVFFVDRGKHAYQLSSKMLLTCEDEKGGEREYWLDLPCNRIGLETLGLWEDSGDLKFNLRYYMTDENAEILSAPCALTTVYIHPPKIDKIYFEEDESLLLEGKFTQETVIVQLLRDGIVIKEEPIFRNKIYIKDVLLYECEDSHYSVRCFYREERGDSPYSNEVKLNIKKPIIESCSYQDGNYILKMGERAVYDIRHPHGRIVTDGSTIRLQKDLESADIRYYSGGCYGPVLETVPHLPALYPLTNDQGIYYYLQNRQDEFDLSEDIEIILDSSKEEDTDYKGAFFQVAIADGMAVLTIKKEIYAADSVLVKADFAAARRHYKNDHAVASSLCSAVRDNMPMRAEDFIYYYYDCSPEDGFTGICPGMSLLTEYTLYQNIPDAKQNLADLSGFAGTGAVRYQVVQRDQKLKIEPFASSVNFVVDPPKTMTSDNKGCGGAGLADLLYTGFSSSYMRLVYPAQFTERTSVGDLRYTKNVCLIAADDIASLEEATEHMRKGALSVQGVAYNYFRGRSLVIPQIAIRVYGSTTWVSVGTTLSDILTQYGAADCTLLRQVQGESYPVISPKPDMPLVGGDKIQ